MTNTKVLRKSVLSLAMASLMALPMASFAQEVPKGDCGSYAMTPGIDVDTESENLRILATSAVSPFDNSMSSVLDAVEEATMDAKARIAKFLKEDIQSDDAVDKVTNESQSTEGGKKKEQLVTRVKKLRNNAQALLRGVVVLGSCHTPNQEVRVTVGVKSETIAAAERAVSTFNSSFARVDKPSSRYGNSSHSSSNYGSKSSNDSGVVGFSDSSRLSRF